MSVAAFLFTTVLPSAACCPKIVRESLSLTAFIFELKTFLFSNAVNYRRVAAAVCARRLSDRLIDQLFRMVSCGFSSNFVFDSTGSAMVCHPL